MSSVNTYNSVERGSRKRRRGDGGIYLVVTDETEESHIALRYAARRAVSNRGHVGILYVIDSENFQHWSIVEERMRRELRERAEKNIWNIAKKVNDLNGLFPVLYIREGNRSDAVVDIINGDTSIRALVLGGGTGAAGPGALIAHFSGNGLGRLRVPLMIVPGHLEPQKIDAIT